MQLLLSARHACGCPTGGVAQRPSLNESGFQWQSWSCGRSLFSARCASEATTSPRSRSPHARKRLCRTSAHTCRAQGATA
eukprot:6201278-Pleurochrysis_carterae.AAC.1